MNSRGGTATGIDAAVLAVEKWCLFMCWVNPQGTHESQRISLHESQRISFAIKQEPHCPCAHSSAPPHRDFFQATHRPSPFTSSGIRDSRYLEQHHVLPQYFPIWSIFIIRSMTKTKIWPRSQIRIKILNLHARFRSDPRKHGKVWLSFVNSIYTISSYFTHARHACHLSRAAHVFG